MTYICLLHQLGQDASVFFLSDLGQVPRIGISMLTSRYENVVIQFIWFPNEIGEPFLLKKLYGSTAVLYGYQTNHQRELE